jgi:hypothetical protein
MEQTPISSGDAYQKTVGIWQATPASREPAYCGVCKPGDDYILSEATPIMIDGVDVTIREVKRLPRGKEAVPSGSRSGRPLSRGS